MRRGMARSDKLAKKGLDLWSDAFQRAHSGEEWVERGRPRRGHSSTLSKFSSSLTDASALGLNHPLRLKTMVMSGSDLGMRRRRALWRATHRGSKEMDFLLGRFAAAALDGMNAAEIGVFERLIDTPDPDIDMSLFRGKSLGEADLDELIGRLRRFHRLEQAD